MTGTKITDIAYRRAAGQRRPVCQPVQMYFATPPTQLQYVRAGQMKPYGVASPERRPRRRSSDARRAGSEGLNR